MQYRLLILFFLASNLFFSRICTMQNISLPEGNIFYNVGHDFLYLHRSLFSWDTLKIGAVFVPCYVASRSADTALQDCFYCYDAHKNCRQLPEFCHTSSDKGVVALTVALGSSWILPFSEHFKLTSRVYASGIFPLWGLKNLFKNIKHKGCLRPKCEHFCKETNYYGGCPSGHMSFISYSTTVFGLQMGPSFGVPLGIASVGVFASSINSNRHYLSQVVAGAGLGIIYGIAASKVVDAYMGSTRVSDFSVNYDSSSGLELSYSF